MHILQSLSKEIKGFKYMFIKKLDACVKSIMKIWSSSLMFF